MPRESIPYECPNLGEWVVISYNRVVHRSSRTGLKDMTFFQEFNCNSEKRCGVVNENGDYDWVKCAHILINDLID